MWVIWSYFGIFQDTSGDFCFASNEAKLGHYLPVNKRFSLWVTRMVQKGAVTLFLLFSFPVILLLFKIVLFHSSEPLLHPGSFCSPRCGWKQTFCYGHILAEGLESPFPNGLCILASPINRVHKELSCFGRDVFNFTCEVFHKLCCSSLL